MCSSAFFLHFTPLQINQNKIIIEANNDYDILNTNKNKLQSINKNCLSHFFTPKKSNQSNKKATKNLNAGEYR